MSPAVADMGLELKLCAIRTVGGFLRAASATESGDGARAARLEESIKRLEEEKQKIEAFKRELPLCMHLLCDVIEGLNEEIERCRGENSGRVFEEFIPAKSKVAEDGVKAEADCEDKMKWMSSAQLWSHNYCKNNNDAKVHDKISSQEKGGGDHGGQEKEENLSLACRSRSSKGGFVPFKGPSVIPASCKEDEEKPELSLQSPAISNPLALVKSANHHGDGCGASKAAVRAPEPSPATAVGGAHLSFQQLSRKARRCWSQELHRRFVLAIQQLGGAEVATPKQIREQMKVEGLTNDEVKSHLQKYRMHTRRTSSDSSAISIRPGGAAGDIWKPNEQHTSPPQQSFLQSSSPQSPFQLAGSAHAVSATAADSSEEDGKSETHSWR